MVYGAWRDSSSFKGLAALDRNGGEVEQLVNIEFCAVPVLLFLLQVLFWARA